MSFLGEEFTSTNRLAPWRVILACLFEIDSYDIPGLIDASGMTVDWSLTERENYSDKYRKAAFRPRINKTYEALSGDDKLRVAFKVSKELACRGLADKLNSDLQLIGWHIEGGTLSPSTETVRELFFPQGTQHDAYLHIKEILRQATRSVRIVDPYLDGTVFTILRGADQALTVEILTAKLPPDFSHESEKFQQQYAQMKVEVRRSRDFHDRFIIIDETECWHVGCSIKDAGNKAFMLSRIEDPKNVQALLDSLKTTWLSAK